jgi:alkylated DNA repair dioxygenase AlkB
VIGERWQHQDLGAGAVLDHAPAWIPAGEAAALLVALRDELGWEQREIVLFGRPVLQPRLIAWGGALPYRYSGQTLPPRPLPARVGALVERVNRILDLRERRFNHVLANRYRDGQDSMGMHADAEPELGDDPVVATLSFGAARRMTIAPRQAATGPRRDLLLGAGDLLIMGGTCQRFFRHGIPRQRGRDEAVGERISLTLRHVLRAPPG